jgi:hypothetical protein
MIRSLTLALVLSACGRPEATDDAQALSDEGAMVRVSSTGEAPLRFAKHYEIDSTDAVYFVADLAASQGTHTAAFEVHDPLGNVYQRTTQPFEIATAHAQVIEVLPVNGTWISQYDMAGQWSCHLFIDDASTESWQVAFILH